MYIVQKIVKTVMFSLIESLPHTRRVFTYSCRFNDRWFFSYVSPTVVPRESSQLLYVTLLYIICIRFSFFISLISISRSLAVFSVLSILVKPPTIKVDLFRETKKKRKRRRTKFSFPRIAIDDKHFEIIACPFGNFIRKGWEERNVNQLPTAWASLANFHQRGRTCRWSTSAKNLQLWTARGPSRVWKTYLPYIVHVLKAKLIVERLWFVCPRRLYGNHRCMSNSLAIRVTSWHRVTRVFLERDTITRI